MPVHTALLRLFDSLYSIVAVHGLGGDAYGTWSDVDRFWLRDFLPSQIPRARIMTYGYDSVVAFSKSTAGIEEFAKDLLTRLSNERDTSQVHDFVSDGSGSN